MNFQQLEYIVAVDTHRHFVTAAAACNITQATLSMMIKKLEEELGLVIFDRSRHPVIPTAPGELLIAQAKVVLQETRRMKETVQELKGELQGELHLGILPTVAPYLLPLFLPAFLERYPLLRIRITELTTEQNIERLKQHQLDAAILATPVNNNALQEHPLYYEQFVAYASAEDKMMKKKYVLPGDIDLANLWLLEEGHCLRTQVLNLCELRKQKIHTGHLEYAAGSIETLKKMVDANQGVTILPELAINDLSAADKKKVRHFKAPAPVREISIVTYRHFTKQRIIEALKSEIMAAVPPAMLSATQKEITKLS